MTGGALQLGIIETDAGNILFLKTRFLLQQSVLIMSTTKKMSIGKLRFITKKLAESIAGITE